MINRHQTVACLSYETSYSCFPGNFSNNEAKLLEISNPVKTAIVKVCCLPAACSNINHALLVTIILRKIDRCMLYLLLSVGLVELDSRFVIH